MTKPIQLGPMPQTNAARIAQLEERVAALENAVRDLTPSTETLENLRIGRDGPELRV